MTFFIVRHDTSASNESCPAPTRSRFPHAASAALGQADAAAWQALQVLLARVFTPARGFDDIVRINVLDGVRVYFRNGDIAHVRASGNAPQLRIYAGSDTQARADRIVALGLADPGGILRELLELAPATD